MDDERDNEERILHGENRPAEADAWLEQIVQTRKLVTSHIAPGIDRATFGATMVAASALIPYRAITAHSKDFEEWANMELMPYYTEKGSTPKDRARGLVRYILTELTDEQARGAMELTTWTYSTVLYLDHLMTTVQWRPYPLELPQISEKIDELGGIFGGKALWDKHLADETRAKNSALAAAKRELRTLKAEKLGKNVDTFNREEEQRKREEEQKKRAPAVAKLLHTIAKKSKPLVSLDDPFCNVDGSEGGTPVTGGGDKPTSPIKSPDWDMETELAFRIPGTNEWRLFDERTRLFLLEQLLKM